jgi:hypothetical protein
MGSCVVRLRWTRPRGRRLDLATHDYDLVTPADVCLPKEIAEGIPLQTLQVPESWALPLHPDLGDAVIGQISWGGDEADRVAPRHGRRPDGSRDVRDVNLEPDTMEVRPGNPCSEPV